VIASILEGQTAARSTDLELGTPTFDRARADLLAMQDRYKADAEVGARTPRRRPISRSSS
jgi:hypothetical protein